MFKRIGVHLHNQGCYTVQWNCQQLAKLQPKRSEANWLPQVKHSETSCRGWEFGGCYCAMLLCNAEKIDKIIAIIVAKGRIKFSVR